MILSCLTLNSFSQDKSLLPFDLYFIAYDSQISESGDFKLVLKNREPIEIGQTLGITNGLYNQTEEGSIWEDQLNGDVQRIEFTNLIKEIPRGSVISIESEYFRCK